MLTLNPRGPRRMLTMDFASWKDRKDLARELKTIYVAIDDKALGADCEPAAAGKPL